jgi:hypothetical protein
VTPGNAAALLAHQLVQTYEASVPEDDEGRIRAHSRQAKRRAWARLKTCPPAKRTTRTRRLRGSGFEPAPGEPQVSPGPPEDLPTSQKRAEGE